MKKIRVFAIGSHTFIERVSGVDFLRILQPMKALHGYKDDTYEFDVHVYDPSTGVSFDWRDIFQEYDVVYFNYTTNDMGYAVMGLMAQKYNKKLILDIDDDLWNLTRDNTSYDIFKSGSWGRTVVTDVAGDVAHVTCTNKHLKNSIMANTIKKSKEITVLPNYINLDTYNHRCEFKDRGYYKAIHFGSSTHFNSLYSMPFVAAMDRIMYRYPNFSFTTVGAFVSEFKNKWGARYTEGFGDTDVLKWIDKQKAYMDDADFMLVPMNVNIYNKSKSNTKFLEASSYKIPGIWQAIRQYKELVYDGENGFLCETEDEWYNAIEKMMTDAKLRKSMGERAFESMKPHQIQQHVKDYADMIKEVLDK